MSWYRLWCHWRQLMSLLWHHQLASTKLVSSWFSTFQYERMRKSVLLFIYIWITNNEIDYVNNYHRRIVLKPFNSQSADSTRGFWSMVMNSTRRRTGIWGQLHLVEDSHANYIKILFWNKEENNLTSIPIENKTYKISVRSKSHSRSGLSEQNSPIFISNLRRTTIFTKEYGFGDGGAASKTRYQDSRTSVHPTHH